MAEVHVMKALCWHGKNDVRVDTVPDSKIQSPRDAVVRVTATAICGSDLHLLDGYMPTMEAGDVLGHEFMGEVVESGNAVHNLKLGGEIDPSGLSPISRNSRTRRRCTGSFATRRTAA